jgi:hypothetical protein
MYKYLAALFLFFSYNFLLAQSPFSGKLVYKGTFMDTTITNKDSSVFITIFCNDSLTRTETFNERIGKQVYIEHLRLNKGYLLLYYQGKKFAIQQLDTSKTVSKYTFKRKFGKKTIQGIKCKKVMVNHPDFEQPYLMYYAPKIMAKYNKATRGMKGLPVDYYVKSADGVIHYQLISFEPFVPDYNLFGVPSDFKKVSFDEFMEQIGN